MKKDKNFYGAYSRNNFGFLPFGLYERQQNNEDYD